jgi:hypothetical protein
LGYFLIFISLTPGAYDHLKRYITCNRSSPPDASPTNIEFSASSEFQHTVVLAPFEQTGSVTASHFEVGMRDSDMSDVSRWSSLGGSSSLSIGASSNSGKDKEKDYLDFDEDQLADEVLKLNSENQ